MSDATTRLQETEATVAVTLVCAGLNFVTKKDVHSFQHITAIVERCMQDLANEAVLTDAHLTGSIN
jgi:hypothetical protein